MTRRLFSLLLILAAPAVVSAAEGVRFETIEGGLRITIDGEPFARYVYRDPVVKRPYFTDLRAPGGIRVTRNHPPIPGSDPTDHADMHPGLWLAFGDISGKDFWRNKGTVEHVGFVGGPASSGSAGEFSTKNRYVAEGEVICEEVRRIAISSNSEGFRLDWDSTFQGDRDFSFGDQEEMGLGIRLATPIAVKNGGRIENGDGLVNEKQVWGKTSAWCDYSGRIDGQPVGVALVPGPNFRPSWFHARDYGLLVANPFGEKAFTKGRESRVVVKAGESLRLRFSLRVRSKAEIPRTTLEN